MTLKIEFDLHPDHGDLREQLVNHVAAIGFTPMSAPSPAPEQRTGSGSVGNVVAAGTRSEPGETAVGETQQRERGKPAQGRARRTKEEIAEDEAADAAGEPEEPTGRSISADPENRTGPEDDAEHEAQDAADEAAEVEESRTEEAPLTREDVKAAMTAYVKTYGLPATQEDGPKLIGSALGKPPKGEEYWKLSLVPDDQDALRKVVDTFRGAVSKNPFSREQVS